MVQAWECRGSRGEGRTGPSDMVRLVSDGFKELRFHTRVPRVGQI